jgi:hypothetical protein
MAYKREDKQFREKIAARADHLRTNRFGTSRRDSHPAYQYIFILWLLCMLAAALVIEQFKKLRRKLRVSF